MVTTARTDEVRTRTTVGAVVSVGYGFGCYLAFVAVFLYAVAFLADFVVPRTVDRGGPHAGTADSDDRRRGAARGLRRPAQRDGASRVQASMDALVPRHVERSTYVLVASAALALVVLAVAPDPDGGLGRADARLHVCCCGRSSRVGMGLGPRHDVRDRPRRHVRTPPGRPPPPRTRATGAVVRPPAAAPTGPSPDDARLLSRLSGRTHDDGRASALRGARLAYILVGVRLEERDLERELPEYAAYAAVTPRFVPRKRTPHRPRSST